MIDIKDLHKSYQMGTNSLHVLKGINFEAKQGEMVAIMGSSGSGKSTFLNIIGMLDEADSGNYQLDGREIKNLNEKIAAKLRNQFLGFVFQSFNLVPVLSAKENVSLVMLLQNVPRHERDRRAKELLDEVNATLRELEKASMTSGNQTL